jgi:hypothetical protein
MSYKTLGHLSISSLVLSVCLVFSDSIGPINSLIYSLRLGTLLLATEVFLIFLSILFYSLYSYFKIKSRGGKEWKAILEAVLKFILINVFLLLVSTLLFAMLFKNVSG